ncbi:MAG: hypothetical protein IJP68_02050 [Selenomonadaceae bacterium]|nr:hypothetical protein [Selenomonadaceae bacterium]
MDFEKIFKDFKAAEAADDFETISEIFLAVNKYCGGLAQAGRANEIPPDAHYIGQYVHVMIYQATKFLNDGKIDKAKFYLLALAKADAAFEKFSNNLYLLAKSLYATGDYPNALKIFNAYEQNRYAKWKDVDELSLFYRANCLASLKNFNAAKKIYKQILAIKADFPEVQQNLELVRRGSKKNLVMELSSLWNFPNWRDVPIFINARDRLGVMKKLIDWLLDAGYRKLIILDNASTYPLLLKYYSALEKDSRLKIIRLGKNLGFKALWLSGVLEKLKISTPYVYTDPDLLPIETCPKDFVETLMKLLDANHELRKVGLGLVYDDITFPDKARTQETEKNFYEGSRVGENLYFAQVDTTFALYSNTRHYSLRFSLRTTGDLRAYHLPWYFDYDNLPADEKYYLEHADKNSITSVKNALN